MSVDNILSVYTKVDRIDMEEGMLAYQRYHESLKFYARHYGVEMPHVIGAFSALSPNNDYMGNLRSLVTLLEGRRRGARVEDCTVSTYKACRNRAWNFLNGADFLDVTKGKKTRNFYLNILNPFDPEPVTIDGHMACIYVGKRMTMKEVVRSRFKYDIVADAFRSAARDVDLLPNQLQAMLWFTWKRIHNVIYTGDQLDAFADLDGNHWGTSIDPARIRPFPIAHR